MIAKLIGRATSLRALCCCLSILEISADDYDRWIEQLEAGEPSASINGPCRCPKCGEWVNFGMCAAWATDQTHNRNTP